MASVRGRGSVNEDDAAVSAAEAGDPVVGARPRTA